jgi:hypothetical protein
MTSFRNVSPLGALDVPDLGRVVEADEVFEVPEHLAPMFAAQPANYAAVDEVATSLATAAAEAQAAAEAAALADVEPVDESPAEPVDEAPAEPAPSKPRRRTSTADSSTDQEVTR